MSTSNKNAIIVGYGRAVGNVVLEALLDADFAVGLIARNQTKLNQEVEKYTSKGYDVKGYSYDLSSLDGIPDLYQKIKKEMGGEIDLCYNNVALFSLPFTQDTKAIQAGLNINFGSIWTFFSCCLEDWQKTEKGIFMMSGGSFADNGAYAVDFNAQFGSTAKAFIRNFAEGANASFNQKGIHIVDLKISNLVFGGDNIPDEFNQNPEEATAFRQRLHEAIVAIINEKQENWKSTYPVE